MSLQEARDAARLAVIRCLASLSHVAGSLMRVERILRVSCYVDAAPGFVDLPAVADGASQFLHDLFGEDRGQHARSVVGVAELPNAASVKIDLAAAVGSQ